jgi:hypothetical protein
VSHENDLKLLVRNLLDASTDLVKASRRTDDEPLGNLVVITRQEMWDLIRFQVEIHNFRKRVGNRNIDARAGRHPMEELAMRYSYVEALLRINPRRMDDKPIGDLLPSQEEAPPLNIEIPIQGGGLPDPDALVAAIAMHFNQGPPMRCPEADQGPCEYESFYPGLGEEFPPCIRCGTVYMVRSFDPPCSTCDHNRFVCTCCGDGECNAELSSTTTWNPCPACRPSEAFRLMCLEAV